MTTRDMDVVAAAVAYLRASLAQLHERLMTQVVVLDICPPTVVSWANPAAVGEIARRHPWTISWNNVMDYMPLAAFHALACACSAPEDTIHVGYSMN
ncbi:Aste57867_14697 [Aphanomyces stellatus]|uniref:Aste57867_14697 protein n=1 Tax=Aphanomyces stellatus TaxID=120398 RepID=A0A485L1N4_9STRA|nr:hypothetical protein As57867_014642 [Aphanomyces stellatus]VFT91515.1 Aste57867_14697 [Aphanomyces stellatus]